MNSRQESPGRTRLRSATRQSAALLGAAFAIALLTPGIAGAVAHDILFGHAQYFRIRPYVTAVALADLNGDHRADLVFSARDTLEVWISVPGDSFVHGQRFTSFGATEIKLADVTQDGFADIVVPTYGVVFMYFPGHGDGTFGARVSAPIGGRGISLAVGDVTHDGIPDVVALDESGQTMVMTFGTGGGGMRYATYYYIGYFGTSVGLADLDHDGWPEAIVQGGHPNNKLSVFIGSVGPSDLYPTASGAIDLAIADVNEDGVPDVVCGNAFSAHHSLALSLGNSNATLSPSVDIASGIAMYRLLTGDFDADGHADFAGIQPESGLVGVVPGNGDGTFGTPALFGAGPNPGAIGTGDINGDGLPDLVIGDGDDLGTMTVLFNLSGQPTPALPTLRRFVAGPNHVVLDWFAVGRNGSSTTVQRRAGLEDWRSIGSPVASGRDELTFDDATVRAGGRYGYRLEIVSGSDRRYSAETLVEVPREARPALRMLGPNPSRDALAFEVEAMNAAPSAIELRDVTGRLVAETRWDRLEPGSHTVTLGGATGLRAGIYFARFTQGQASAAVRVCVIR